MPSTSSSAVLLTILLSFLSPTLVTIASATSQPNPVSRSQSTTLPTAIASAPQPSSTSNTLTKIPQCGQSCLTNATLSLPCDSTDTQCLCAHSSAIQSLTHTCLASTTCSQSDKDTTTTYYDALCVSLGYPLTANPTASLPASTGSTPTHASTATGSASNASTNSSGKVSRSGISSSTLSIIVGVAIGGALVLVCTLTICFLMLRRRRQAQEAENGENKERKASDFSNSSSPASPASIRTETFSNKSPADGVGHDRQASNSTVFTMVSLAPSNRGSASRPERNTFNTMKTVDTKNTNTYSTSNYSTYTQQPISPILPPISTMKKLPAEPRGPLSPALAAFDFEIGGNSNVGVAQGSGSETFVKKEEHERDAYGQWGQAAVQGGRDFVYGR